MIVLQAGQPGSTTEISSTKTRIKSDQVGTDTLHVANKLI